MNASVPIWDWGERGARIEAARVNLRRSTLQLEEAEVEIVSDVENEIQDVLELQAWAVTNGREPGTRGGHFGPEPGRVSRGLPFGPRSVADAPARGGHGGELLDAYTGWRQSILQLQELTYYNFEFDVPVMECYGLEIDSLAFRTGG